MATHSTDLQLQDTYCTALTEWFHKGYVDIQQYPDKHQPALHAQQRIGWQHMLMGHLATQWEKIHRTNQTRITDDTQLWTAAIIETTLSQVRLLWEQRNLDVHGKNDKEQKTLLLQKQKRIIAALMDKKTACLACDRWVFPEDATELMDHNSTTVLAEWIATRKPVILKSVQLAKEQDLLSNHTITKWIKQTKDITINGIRMWSDDPLRYDPFNKKKKRRKPRTQSAKPRPTYQQTMTHYFNTDRIH